MTDHFNGIAVFVEVANAASFTRADERLGLTKSAVSKAITRLEERLGETLFTRSTRNLTLTVSGEAYLASCVAAIDILRDTEDALGGHGEAPRGRLRIDMPAAFGRRVLVPLLTEICKANPDLQLSLSFTDRVIDPIEEGVDLVVRFGRSRDAAGLMAKTLVEQPQHICASPAYLARHGTPASLDDLAQHVCLVGFRSVRAYGLASAVSGQMFVARTPRTISPGRSNRSRPSIECHFSDGEKFVDRSAVARLNGHAFHDRIDEFA
ncbi:hypothetical protein SPHINGO391_240029 [Sphingomonas aurantiaca]|uniref:HTH lysR-type domain-containing protein n=1 Tax=Sphingomonas aurantiaca TaxID=185949 RepID=A0A5E7XWF6_9SPHN|nr:hypothetical protein SPHINGO391_240029 [Sphingomonas aurantiaca]